MKIADYRNGLCAAIFGALMAANIFAGYGQRMRSSAAKHTLETGFITPADSIQTSVYWYWMSDNISREGVVRDLKAMKSVGINRAFIGNIGYPGIPYGKVKLLSDEWWEIMRTALKTATELNIEIGIFNSPGWSQSGGPWIKPEQSMRYLTSSERIVTGPGQVSVLLDKPAAKFQDVKVIAFKAASNYGSTLSDLHPKITSPLTISSLNSIMDGFKTDSVPIIGPGSVILDFEVDQEYTARSIAFYPARNNMSAMADFQVKENGTYRSLKKIVIDRSNGNLNVGFDPYGPVSASVPATSAKGFRLVFTQLSPKFALKEIEISSVPKIENYIEKTLAKMFQAPHPYWKEYQWPQQPVVDDQNLVIDPTHVRDISTAMNADGLLTWTVPQGRWVIMRMGMTPTGVTNSPATPEGTGLEVDKMSKEHIAAHFNAFLGEIQRRIPPKDRKTWRVTVEDSYETGSENWTDDMTVKFKANYGYDPTPFLPALSGKVIGSQDMSDRFLWDLRRFIADRVAYDYVAGLREISHQHGLHTWLENYGHWGFPGEFLQYGGQSDEVAGEFWSEGELGDIENRAASSAAHIYGKNKVSAESFTAGGKAYARYPALMKQRGDRFFTEGINNTLLHLFIEQPDERLPGINAPFGNEFNRHNTWFSDLDLFTQYLKRCNYLLQQGRYVADVAYFIGEDAPKMTGICDPELPKGYSFDYINAEVIKKITKVQHGRIFLDNGMSYCLLVLPKLKTIRPELLSKIRALVEQGAVILGPKPKWSPSLQDYPACDTEVERLAQSMWGGDLDTAKAHPFGRGLVLSGMDMQSALNKIGIRPDFKELIADSLLFIHRRDASNDIYFVSNQSQKSLTFNPGFRVNDKQPWVLDAVSGEIRRLYQFSSADGFVQVPLTLAPLQSLFILFKKSGFAPEPAKLNFPEPKVIATLDAPWKVSFDHNLRGPLKPIKLKQLIDWQCSKLDSVKYYSGHATYRTSFKIAGARRKKTIYLNLGDVKVIAKVKINGKYMGGAWTAPWRVDITKAIRPGRNRVEIIVANNWMNRLIGDSKLPASERRTFTSVNNFSAASSLQSSGLIGPVTLTLVSQ